MSQSMILITGIALLATTATFLGQGANEPVRSAPEYFVTAEGDAAHLWVREGTTLRIVGHGICKECPLDKPQGEHKEGDGHDHDKK